MKAYEPAKKKGKLTAVKKYIRNIRTYMPS